MKIPWIKAGKLLSFLKRDSRVVDDISFNLLKTSEEKIEWYLNNLKETRNILIEDQEKLLSFYNQISDILQTLSSPLTPECLYTVYTLLSETETLMTYHLKLSDQREKIALKINWCALKYSEALDQGEEKKYQPWLMKQLELLQN